MAITGIKVKDSLFPFALECRSKNMRDRFLSSGRPATLFHQNMWQTYMHTNANPINLFFPFLGVMSIYAHTNVFSFYVEFYIKIYM